jgi:hypothetical protein
VQNIHIKKYRALKSSVGGVCRRGECQSIDMAQSERKYDSRGCIEKSLNKFFFYENFSLSGHNITAQSRMSDQCQLQTVQKTKKSTCQLNMTYQYEGGGRFWGVLIQGGSPS